MELPKIDVKPRKLAELLHEMTMSKLQVPRFQRDFVWPLSKTQDLLDSMYKEFPIGTFFLWQAPGDSPHLVRPLKELGIAEPKPGADVAYILDGQQRLTSLFATIKGLTVNGRDYGRICLDLQVATEYEANKEEGFERKIFIQRDPDNKRFIAVKDLVGQSALMIFSSVPPEWQPAFNKAYNLFQTYPFSVVSIQEQTLADAIEIFQRINQAGQRLSRYDLVCANLWSEEFDFRKQVKLLNQKLMTDGFGELHETIYTQTFALILKDRCTTEAELSLKTEEIMQTWDKAIRSLQLAITFIANNMGVKHVEFLPYRGLVPVLAYYFYHVPNIAISARERDGLWQWFWQVSLSERYSSTSPSRMAEDALKLRKLMEGQEVTFDYLSRVTPEAITRTKMTSGTSALRNAVLCMLTLRQPKNFKDNSPVSIREDFFTNLKRPERHHIFPVGYLKSKGFGATAVHLVPNFCFIPGDLNREIGSRPPAEYLAAYKDGNPNFTDAARSHYLPVGSEAAVWRNDYDGFLIERARLIAAELNRYAQGKPDEFVTVDADRNRAVAAVDFMELKIRNFIDHRLTAVIGPNYWKQGIPGEVKSDSDKLIAKRLQRHPGEDPNQYLIPRRRLDFCVISDYERIVNHNWPHFQEIVKQKPTFATHLHAFGALRNALHHNNEPTDVERKLGEAAILWFESMLNRYEQDVQAAESTDEDEDDLPNNGVED